MKFARIEIIASTVLAIGLAACGGKTADTAVDNPAPATAETAPAADVAPAAEPAPAAPAATEAADDAPAGARDLGERSIAMMKAMAAAAADNVGDCDKQAAALQVIVDDNRGLIAESAKADEDEAVKRWLEQNYGKQAMEIMGPMMGHLQACSGHAGLAKVFEAFE